MKILALILARGGSKRLPGKNIRMLGDKPLIVWSIEVAQNIPEICEILVSTDDRDIAEISENAGAYVPWLRPAELATDTASSVDAALHALDWYETNKNQVIDGVLLLQPTSPFRTKETIRKGIELFLTHGRQAVLGISKTHMHPMNSLKMRGESLVRYFDENNTEANAQDYLPAYVINGSFYLISPHELRDRQSFVGIESIPLLIESQKESIDIDTEWDFKMGEFTLRYQDEFE